MGKHIGLSTSNDELVIQALIENRRDRKKGKSQRYKKKGLGKENMRFVAGESSNFK